MTGRAEQFIDQVVKPWVRPVRNAAQRRRARRLAVTPSAADDQPNEPMRFIIACGRSGTTILAEMLAMHPGFHVIQDPYHLYAEVEPDTDVTNLHRRTPGRFVMRAEHASPEAPLRFRRIMDAVRRDGGGLPVIEKTPQHAARIEFLEVLAPGSRYLHIARDGVSVARSIDQIATRGSYRMIGRPDYNQWWGSDGAKWTALAADGAAIGCFADEIPLLRTHAARGAYEWVLTHEEIDSHRAALGDRLLDITLDGLTADPRGALRAVCEHFGLDAPDRWLDEASAKIVPARARRPGETLELPPRLCARFNEIQARYGFDGRAVVAGEGSA
jgi:hypothetical protein